MCGTNIGLICDVPYLFFREESRDFVEMGALNALFVLGRSMGFIGKYTYTVKPVNSTIPWDQTKGNAIEEMMSFRGAS
jgi:hypothetical protein